MLRRISTFPIKSRHIARSLHTSNIWNMPVKHATTDAEVRSLISAEKVVVIDFFAEWCGPCKVISPQLDKMSEKYTGAKFIKCDVDELATFASESGIKAMPTFHVFKDGKLMKEVVGARVKELEDAIKAAL